MKRRCSAACRNSGRRSTTKSVESATHLGWTAAAVLGGVIADARGYGFTFTIAASIQGAVVVAMACTLLPLVPKEGRSRETSERERPRAQTARYRSSVKGG